MFKLVALVLCVCVAPGPALAAQPVQRHLAAGAGVGGRRLLEDVPPDVVAARAQVEEERKAIEADRERIRREEHQMRSDDLVAHGQPALPPYSPGWTYGGDTATVTVEPSPESPPPPPSPSPESPPPPMDSPDAFFNQFEMAGDEGSPDPVPSPPPSPPADPPPSPPSPPPSSPPSPPPPSPPSPSPVRAFRSASDGTDSPPPPTPSPPPPTQSPPPPPQPPAGGETYEGDLTYYGGAGTGGSCTQDYVPPGFDTVAMNNAQYEDGKVCGTCVDVTFSDNSGEKRFQAIVDNLCPECGYGSLDYGTSGDGRWPVKWSVIECPSASIKVSQQGSNPNYAKVKFQGGPGRINGVTCAGGEGESTPDGYYLWFSGLGCDAVQCTVDYDIGGGKAATIPAGLLC